jgi:hypothetical protein
MAVNYWQQRVSNIQRQEGKVHKAPARQPNVLASRPALCVVCIDICTRSIHILLALFFPSRRVSTDRPVTVLASLSLWAKTTNKMGRNIVTHQTWDIPRQQPPNTRRSSFLYIQSSKMNKFVILGLVHAHAKLTTDLTPSLLTYMMTGIDPRTYTGR